MVAALDSIGKFVHAAKKGTGLSHLKLGIITKRKFGGNVNLVSADILGGEDSLTVEVG